MADHRTTITLGGRRAGASVIRQRELRAALRAGQAVVLISGQDWYRMRLVRDRLVYERNPPAGATVAYLDAPRPPNA